MVDAPRQVLSNEAAYRFVIANAALSRALAQHELADHSTPPPPEPGAHRNGEPHLGTREDAGRQDAFHALAQDPFGRESLQLQPGRETGRELDQPVVEEGDAALDRGSHAHLVLLHQQLMQVCLAVDIEQPIELRPRVGPFQVFSRDPIRVGTCDPLPGGGREQLRLLGARKHGEVVEVSARQIGRQAEKRAFEFPPGERSRPQMLDRTAHRATDARRDDPVVRGSKAEVVQRLGVAPVAREQLVAALPRQHHLHVFRGQARYEIQRHARRMRQWLVLVPHQRRQGREEIVGTHHDFVMVGTVGVGHRSCVAELVCLPLCERDGKGLDRLVDEPAHDGRNRSRVDPAREKHSQRNVRHQAHAHGLGEALAEFRDESLVRAALAIAASKAQVPVPANLHHSVAPPQRVAR